jgi:protein-tyrosine-phosphatase
MRATQLANPSLEFLRLLAHPIRWRVLLSLAHSDYRVQELVSRVHQPQNLVSYHLRRLRTYQLIHERRSAADGRDIYYSLDLDKFKTLYLQTGQNLHPGVGSPEEKSQTKTVPSSSKPVRVLFLCTHNSARSQMAEGLLRHLGGNRVEVFSAGSEPTTIQPLAIKTMQHWQINISGQYSKNMSQYFDQHFDYIITVCDRVRESCPVFPGDPEHIHWSFPDPMEVTGSASVRERAFYDTALQLTTRINYLLLMIDRTQSGKYANETT